MLILHTAINLIKQILNSIPLLGIQNVLNGLVLIKVNDSTNKCDKI